MCKSNSEQKWIALARAGDADAFCSLYGLYRERLYRYAFYRLGNAADAEDAVSDCVLSAWKQIGSLRETGAFAAWIFRILSGCCGKLIRQQIQQRQQVSLDAAASGAAGMAAGDAAASGATENLGPAAVSGSDPLQVSEDTDGWLILQEALAQISEEERNIVLLSSLGGLKSREIAELTGMSAGSVRSSLSRSLKKIRGYYK